MKVYNNIKTFLRWAVLAFIIYQAATSTAGMWIALIIGFIIIRLVIRRLPVLYGDYFHCVAFAFNYLIT